MFGAITLNRAVGGLNALAVEIAAREGARTVWVPTVNSANEAHEVHAAPPGAKVPVWVAFELARRDAGHEPDPVAVADGRLLPAARAVLDVIARRGMVPARGHLSRDEIFALVAGAVEAGVRETVVTHPEFPSQRLSYGERGESGELWKQEGQTIDNVKRVRHAEADAAAAHLGVTFRCLDLGDYPLEIDRPALLAIADAIREFAPEVIVTGTDTDPFNPDHPVAFRAVDRARSLAAGAGVASPFPTISPPEPFLFEPPQPELCNFTPTTFVDITAAMDRKRAAMAQMKAQHHLRASHDQRAAARGNHARRGSGSQAIEFAEACQRVLPRPVAEL